MHKVRVAMIYCIKHVLYSLTIRNTGNRRQSIAKHMSWDSYTGWHFLLYNNNERITKQNSRSKPNVVIYVGVVDVACLLVCLRR